jgi:hypothetical protein
MDPETAGRLERGTESRGRNQPGTRYYDVISGGHFPTTSSREVGMRYTLAIAVSLLACVGSVARSQTTEGGMATTQPNTSAASYYYVARPGELTIQVNIWGDVQKPGRYEVASTTDLVQLLSYAGGPTREAKLSEVRISRVVKGDMGLRKQQLTVDLEDIYETDESSLALRPGDAIFVDYVTRFNARDVLSIVTTAALVTAAVAQVFYATKH